MKSNSQGAARKARRGRAAAIVAALTLSAAGCAGLGDLTGSTTPQEPDLEENAIARMSAESRYDQAVGCASTARLILNADTPEKLIALGMEPQLAMAGAADFAAGAEATAVMGEAAARDALAAGAVLGVDEATVFDALEADYQRLEGAFRGVAEPQPQVALFTINDRLQRCRDAYSDV